MFNKNFNTLQQGSVGLACAIYEYKKLGYTVSVPLVDAQDYDLVIEKDGTFYSVQCKTTRTKTQSRSEGVYDVNLRSIRTMLLLN